MDYIKVFLIGLIVVIVYYLLLQWSNLPEEGVVFQPAKEATKTIKEEMNRFKINSFLVILLFFIPNIFRIKNCLTFSLTDNTIVVNNIKHDRIIANNAKK